MEQQPIDKANEVRKGEELDLKKLEDYLASHTSLIKVPIKVSQFPSGYSNLTYLLSDASGKEFVLRRPPHGANIQSAHDMGREFKVLSYLQKVYPKVPTPILFCEESEVLGAQFYIMEKVTGTILRGSLSKKLNLSQDDMRKGSLALVDTLASLHELDTEKTGLNQLGRPEGYVDRQVSGWIKRYRKSETDTLLSMNQLAEWLPKHRPAKSDTTFLHNDFKYDNVVFTPSDLSKIIAVLDWEMATVGDPFMDLGTMLAYWSEAGDPSMLQAFNLTSLPGNLTRQEVLERYSYQRKIDLPDMLFYYAFASFKIGVIVQQIYQRYKNGKTQDPRFAGLLELVKANAANGVRALDKGRISDLYST